LANITYCNIQRDYRELVPKTDPPVHHHWVVAWSWSMFCYIAGANKSGQ